MGQKTPNTAASLRPTFVLGTGGILKSLFCGNTGNKGEIQTGPESCISNG